MPDEIAIVDYGVGNLAFALNLRNANATVPSLPDPEAPPPTLCPEGSPLPTDLQLEDILDLVP